MVTYPLNELQPGMIVAADVFTPRGQLIVLRGSILSQQMIQHMKYYHVPSVTILPNEIDPISFEKADRSEPTYAKRIRQSESFKEFREHYTQSASIFQEQLSRFVAGDAHLDTSPFYRTRWNFSTTIVLPFPYWICCTICVIWTTPPMCTASMSPSFHA